MLCVREVLLALFFVRGARRVCSSGVCVCVFGALCQLDAGETMHACVCRQVRGGTSRVNARPTTALEEATTLEETPMLEEEGWSTATRRDLDLSI